MINVFFTHKNKECVNFNNILRNQFADKFIKMQENISSSVFKEVMLDFNNDDTKKINLDENKKKEYLDDISYLLAVDEMIDFINHLEISNIEIYRKIMGILYADSYIYLNDLEKSLLNTNDTIAIFDNMKKIVDIEMIDHDTLYELIICFLEFYDYDELSRRKSYLNLDVQDDFIISQMHDGNVLDISHYSAQHDLKLFVNYKNEQIKEEIQENNIIEKIKNYLLFLKNKCNKEYQEKMSNLIIYNYKWSKYLKDHVNNLEKNKIEDKIVTLFIKNDLKDIINIVEEDNNLFYEIINSYLYYETNKKDVIYDKSNNKIEITIDDVENYYIKTKK
ncbi:MAG: hypothetical protein PHN42_04235 [Bacilli bacterium]|nr:hypothetical protein [Bacilli bacterium]